MASRINPLINSLMLLALISGLILGEIMNLLSLITPKMWIILIVITAVLGAGMYIKVLQNTIQNTKTEVALKQAQIDNLQGSIDLLSTAKAEIEAKAKDAEIVKSKIRAELQATLRKLRNTPIPTECTAAIKWSIEHASDLKW